MMPFAPIEGIAAPVPIANIDTDMLVPARFLKTISREGLAEALFYNLRTSNPAFPLDLPPWNKAQILIALENFGCGSSREHAPWALLDFGVRCVIAKSFAEIFHQNCFKSGILPIVLRDDHVAVLMHKASEPSTARMTISLVGQVIVCGDLTLPFEIDPEKRRRLLSGLDDIELTLAHTKDIERFETRSKGRQPWLPTIPPSLT